MSEKGIRLEDAANLAALIVYMAERSAILNMFISNAKSRDQFVMDGVTYEITVQPKL